MEPLQPTLSSNQTRNWVQPNPATKQELGSLQPRKLGWLRPNPHGPKTKHMLNGEERVTSTHIMDMHILNIVPRQIVYTLIK